MIMLDKFGKKDYKKCCFKRLFYLVIKITKINENEFKWFLMDDEKAEVLMEVTDFIFEDLIENFISEINDY